jgi:hypothetical protein
MAQRSAQPSKRKTGYEIVCSAFNKKMQEPRIKSRGRKHKEKQRFADENEATR